jgi:hypothetical protein
VKPQEWGAWCKWKLIVVPPGVHANQTVACTARTIFLEYTALCDGVEQFLERRLMREQRRWRAQGAAIPTVTILGVVHLAA